MPRFLERVPPRATSQDRALKKADDFTKIRAICLHGPYAHAPDFVGGGIN